MKSTKKMAAAKRTAVIMLLVITALSELFGKVTVKIANKA